MINFLNIIRSVIIFIMSYISFFQFLFGFTSIDELITGNLIWFIDKKYNSVIIGICLLVLWIICSLIIYFTERNNQNKAGKAFHQILHEFRNMVFDLKKENEEYLKSKNVISSSTYYNQIRYKAQTVCEEIANFLMSCFGKKFNVCIKMIDVSSSRATTSIKEMKIITLCRAGVDKIERSKDDVSENILVCNNSDFESILEKDGVKGSNTVFAANNLILYAVLKKFLGEPYKTSSKGFWKKYNSTMVVPIRIDAKRLPSNSDFCAMNQYQVFGFLCIDYKKRISKSVMRNVLEYEKAFGDLLYILFNEVLFGDMVIYKNKLKLKK